MLLHFCYAFRPQHTLLQAHRNCAP